MADTVDIKQKKRFRPVRIVLYLITLCIVIGLVKTFLIPQPKPNIAIDYVEKLNQLTKPENYNPADNAAPIYQQAFKEFKEMPEELEDIIDRWERPSRQLVWPDNFEPEELKQLEGWLNSNNKAFELVALAAEKPYWWVPATSPDGLLSNLEDEHIYSAQDMATALCWRVKLAVAKDDMNTAIIDFELSQKIADQFGNKPTMLEHIVSSGIKKQVNNCILLSLDRMTINNAMLGKLQISLENQSISSSVALTSFDFLLEIEKMGTEEFIQHYFTDDGKGDGYFLLEQWLKELEEMWGGFTALSFSSYPKSVDGIVDYFKDKLGYFKAKREIISKLESRKLTAERLEKYISVVSDISKYSPIQLHNKDVVYKDKVSDAMDMSDNYFLESWGPSVSHFPATIYRSQATHEALITIVAIFRYKNDTGVYPHSLDQLIKTGLLDSLPADPYSDKPILYKNTGDDFILYSVDEDFDDDGGLKKYDQKENDGDFIFWPIPKPKKKPPVAPSTMPGMPMMPGMMPGMPGMPGMPMMPGMMPPPEQPPMDPNMIT